MYYLAINRIQSGPFSEADIRQRLARGEVGSADLCWKEGWLQWRKVVEVFPPATPPVLPPTLSSPAVTVPPLPTSAPVESCGLATASMVCGFCVFVLAPLFFLFAIVAVILGHVAHSKITASGGTLRGAGQATAGLVMGYLGIAGIPIIGLLAAMAIPAFQKVRERTYETTVRNNLVQIWSAAEQQMLEKGVDVVTYDELVADGGYFQDFKPVAGEDYHKITVRRGDESLSVTLRNGRSVSYYPSTAVGGAAEGPAERDEEDPQLEAEPPEPASQPEPEALAPIPALG